MDKEAQKKMKCVRLGCKHKKPITLSNFYQTCSGSIYEGLGVIPICKDCIEDLFEDYYSNCNKDLQKATYYTCRKLDVAYTYSLYNGAVNHKSFKKDDKVSKMFRMYMTLYNSLGKKNGNVMAFDDGETYINESNFEKPVEAEIQVSLDEGDYKNRAAIIDMIEYDPFEGYAESDQKFLYSDLLGYFKDEDVAEDQFLVSQIIQVVNNNNQIRKYDYLISQYTGDSTMLSANIDKVKSMQTLKKEVVNNTDKIAKENNISVKSRKGENVKNGITDIMKKLRALDFEEVEVDYYSQKLSYGMQRASDISMKAMESQLDFTDNKINDLIITQRNLIKDMEAEILELKESKRLLHVETKRLREEINARGEVNE